jgi:hypothetical protein
MVDDIPMEYHDRSMGIEPHVPVFCRTATTPMSTTGKRYIERTGDRTGCRMLDARTKAILNSVMKEGRGRALDAYLRALMPGK